MENENSNFVQACHPDNLFYIGFLAYKGLCRPLPYGRREKKLFTSLSVFVCLFRRSYINIIKFKNGRKTEIKIDVDTKISPSESRLTIVFACN